MTLYAVCLTQTPLEIHRLSDFKRVIRFTHATSSHEAVGLVMESLPKESSNYYTYSAIVPLAMPPLSVDGPAPWVMSRIVFFSTPKDNGMGTIQCLESGTESFARAQMEQHSMQNYPDQEFSKITAATPSLDLIKGCAI